MESCPTYFCLSPWLQLRILHSCRSPKPVDYDHVGWEQCGEFQHMPGGRRETFQRIIDDDRHLQRAAFFTRFGFRRRFLAVANSAGGWLIRPMDVAPDQSFFPQPHEISGTGCAVAGVGLQVGGDKFDGQRESAQRANDFPGCGLFLCGREALPWLEVTDKRQRIRFRQVIHRNRRQAGGVSAEFMGVQPRGDDDLQPVLLH